MKTMWFMLCAMLLTGCSSVVMQEPFPDTQLADQEREALEGVWKLDRTVVYLAVDSNSVPWLATVDRKAGNFVLQKYQLRITKHKDALYVSMPAEPDATNKFVFAEVKSSDKALIAWMPDIGFFEEKIANGTLKGTVEKDKHSTEILLDTPANEILELISSHADSFDYKSPLVFQRLE